MTLHHLRNRDIQGIEYEIERQWKKHQEEMRHSKDKKMMFQNFEEFKKKKTRRTQIKTRKRKTTTITKRKLKTGEESPTSSGHGQREFSYS